MKQIQNACPPEALEVELALETVEIEKEGCITFPSIESASSFRYSIVLKAQQVRIWFENRTTKKQWESKKLRQEDFVSSDAVMPHASTADYVSCFVEALANASEGRSNTCELTLADNDILILEITLMISLPRSIWRPKYKFVLHPIALDRVDLLTSRVQELEQEMTALREQLEKKHASTQQLPVMPSKMDNQVQQAPAKLNASQTSTPVYLQALIAQDAKRNKVMVWKSRQPSEYFDVYLHGAIRFTISGWYQIHIVVEHNNTNPSMGFELQKMTDTIQTCQALSYSGNPTVSHLEAMVRVEKDEMIRVLYTGSGQAGWGTYLTALRVQ